MIAGLIISSKELIDNMRIPYLKDFGGVLSPFDAWLLLRALRPRSPDGQALCQRSKVAEYLENTFD